MLCYVKHTKSNFNFSRQVYIWSSKVKSEDRQSLWKPAGQSTFLHLDYIKTDMNCATVQSLKCSYLLPRPPQELSEFSEGPDLVWTVSGGEFDQVRWISSKGATELATLCFYFYLICLFSHQSTEDSKDELPQIVKKKETLEDVPSEQPWDFCVVVSYITGRCGY